ncbi:hypothetical protein [Enterococcus raffinosus]|uniref:Phage protein n=1 Tax=Enterococcus raffinosus TaxID=71452 RepID=A0AAW8TCQ1_9ENTE|nr:hypothetical protein [Enterococcus raffinosus]MDT2525972.1 hypothetical protein [Enterococcus raffinosus]MDT2536462.1 hypothetical protein [Enterococcus raffinosus]MDT2546910.1 hypothetical protein [Enterococcus raffinosus]MDT2593250.1 hypothetical protein [Enterococcus raffinosus]
MIKKIKALIDGFLLERKLVKVRELLKSHIGSGEHSMYWVADGTEKQNVMNMINFYEIAFEDGYMATGEYFDASLWMSSNPKEVWKMYLEMKEVAE